MGGFVVSFWLHYDGLGFHWFGLVQWEDSTYWSTMVIRVWS